MMNAALELARKGCFVLPLHPIDEDGQCQCGKPHCRSAGKHPITEHGFSDASKDPSVIRKWWSHYPDAGIAIALKRSGLAVIDGDSPDWVDTLESSGLVPPTYTVESRPGHRHYYYRRPDTCPVTQSIQHGQYDILAVGMVVAPPSRHYTGTNYTVVNPHGWDRIDDLPELPTWAVQELTESSKEKQEAREQGFMGKSEVVGEDPFPRVRNMVHPSVCALIEGGYSALDETLKDRSGADWRVATGLIEAGLSDDEVHHIFLTYPIGTEGKAARGGDYLQRTITKARAHVRAKGNATGQPASGQVRFGPYHGGSQQMDLVPALINLARSAELFHSPARDAYARVLVGDHTEVLAIGSGQFRGWLRLRAYQDLGAFPSKDVLDRVVEQVTAHAEFAGKEEYVSLRVAEYSGNLYIDLGNPNWEVVEVTPQGWSILTSFESPVRFWRSNAMKALPTPKGPGSLDRLRHHLNVDDDGWALLVGWLLMAFQPTGPYPILNLSGEQGSAKSTAAKMLRYLTDPSAVPSRGEPKGEDDLRAAVVNNRILVLDNLSHISPWLSDALCRISTEGGFTTRKFYTETSEMLVQARRPVVITSITEVATRSDLIDRGVFVTLQSLVGQWRDEKDVWESFEADAPVMFTGLLDALVSALANQPNVPPQRDVRMADFAKWVIAAEPSLPLEPGKFKQVYKLNRGRVTATALEASPVGEALLDFMEDRQTWRGIAKELKAELETFAELDLVKHRNWPRSAKGMADALRRLQPNLRDLGIEIEFVERESRRRPIEIRKIQPSLSQGMVYLGSGVVRSDDAVTKGATFVIEKQTLGTLEPQPL
jgi:hypothetical protein